MDLIHRAMPEVKEPEAKPKSFQESAVRVVSGAARHQRDRRIIQNHSWLDLRREFKGGEEGGSWLRYKINEPVISIWMEGGLFPLPRVDCSNSTEVSVMDLAIISGLGMDVTTGNGSGTNPLAGYDSVVGGGSHSWSVAGFLLLSRTLRSGMTSPVWSEQGDGCQRC